MLAGVAVFAHVLLGSDWPRFRGPDGNAVADGSPLPVRWSTTENIRWKTAIPGEGSSSPIVWGGRIFLTSAFEKGRRRAVHCLDRETGKVIWTRELQDEDPERTSAMTGHAAATPATDGRRVVAFFGNAGLVCYDFDGKLLWHRKLGDFDTELGLASSPIIHRGLVIQVCDHDGDRFKSFDSFLIALDLETGKERWKTERRGCHRCWSTPIVVPNLTPQPPTPLRRGGQGGEVHALLVVNSPEKVCAYDPETGQLRWEVPGMTDWVAPSPVFHKDVIFAASGKNGPLMAIRPRTPDPRSPLRTGVQGGEVLWQDRSGGPYVCSPVFYRDHLYVHDEQGILSCYDAGAGERRYRERLAGKFTASPIAGEGKLYATSEDGTTFVIKAGPKFELLARNELKEYTLPSPAVAGGRLFVRTERQLYCVGKD